MGISSSFDHPDATSADYGGGMVFLAQWSGEQWDRLLSYTEVRRAYAGEVVIHINKCERALYIVAEGHLEVLTPHGRSIASIDPGSVVGEQLFLDGKPRSADVVAVTEVELRRLSLSAFEVFAAEEPDLARDFLFDLGRILSLRLRETTAQTVNSLW